MRPPRQPATVSSCRPAGQGAPASSARKDSSSQHGRVLWGRSAATPGAVASGGAVVTRDWVPVRQLAAGVAGRHALGAPECGQHQCGGAGARRAEGRAPCRCAGSAPRSRRRGRRPGPSRGYGPRWRVRRVRRTPARWGPPTPGGRAPASPSRRGRHTALRLTRLVSRADREPGPCRRVGAPRRPT